MPGKIFVNYRRDDDPNGAARIRDALAAKFDHSSVFMDVDNLLPGQRFDVELGKALDACDVFIPVIGGRWMDLLQQRYLAREYDYVRAEIAEALQRRIAIIPVRVGREGNMPQLPRPEELPEDLRALVLHQKHDVAYERFSRDAAELIAAIIAVRETRKPQKPPLTQVSWGPIGAMAAGVLAVGCWVGAHQMGVPVWWPFAGDPSPRDPIAVLAPGSGKSARDRLADGSPCPFCPEMVVVPAGRFTMGSPKSEACNAEPEVCIMREEREKKAGERLDDEGPQHEVTIGRPFAVGRFAVTRGEFATFVKETGHDAGGGCSIWDHA